MTLLESFIALDTLNLLALLGVVFIGLPHGAMDGALAMHFGWTSRPAITALFLLSYVGLAGAVVLVWVFAPAVTFVAFLAISIYHFGRGDASSLAAGRTTVESLARGGLVIGGISQMHRSEVDGIFQTLVGNDTSGVWLFLNGVVVITLACVVEAMLFKNQQERLTLALELGVLFLLFLAMPPLVGFALYFCFVHSIRHVSSVQNTMEATVSKLSITKSTAVLSLVTWGVGLAVLAQQTSTVAVDSALLRVVFIGLAALTVPHMILVDGLLHRRPVPA
ncbi:MAG: Brp/Blh family beta-carotene 15,15'-dioxygenase [Candidatus Poseidoniales archaeon]